MRVFPRDSAVEKMLVMEETAFNAGNADLIPGSGTSSGGGNGYPLQYSCLGIPWTETPGAYSPWDHRKSDMT